MIKYIYIGILISEDSLGLSQRELIYRDERSAYANSSDLEDTSALYIHI